MRKIIAISVTLILILTLCACGKKDENLSTDISQTSSISETIEFTPPANYAYVLMLKINPTFNLYLDADNNVLAIQAVNDDAKSLKADINLQDKNFEAVVDKIITAANTEGFITSDAKTISISVSEIKDTNIKAGDILTAAENAAKDTAAKLNLTITVNTANNTDTVTKPTSSKADKTSSKPIQTNTSSSVKDDHVHSYREANCTTPKTCPCGATQGKALGHVYKFNDGICSRCGATDPNHVSTTPITNKQGYWLSKFVIENTLYDVSMTLYGGTENFGMSYGLGDSFATLPEDFQEEIRNNQYSEDYKDSYIIFDGKEYYIGRGDGDGLASVTESGTTVTVTDLNGAKLILTRTDENTLTVKESPSSFSDIGKIPTGIKLTFTEN